jgi:hypothetical protein
MNPSTIARQEINIFNYANGKPQLVLDNNKFIAYCTNTHNREKVILDAPFQRWNHFVFNYYETRCDIFVNGLLNKTCEFGTNIPIMDITKDDRFILGEDNGLDGSICNVQFYSLNLTGTQISRLYNKLVLKNLPLSE